MSYYPEHEKMAGIRDQSQICGEFLEWLTTEGGFHLAQRSDSGPWTVPALYDIAQLLAEFFEIDLTKIEAEKRQMLKDFSKEVNQDGDTDQVQG